MVCHRNGRLVAFGFVEIDVSGYIAHSTPYFHGVCGYDTPIFFVEVAQFYSVVLTLTFVEAEGTQINPCTASHLLVYMKKCSLSAVHHGICGGVRTLLKGLIRNVYGVIACYGNVRSPCCQGCVSFFYGSCLA